MADDFVKKIRIQIADADNASAKLERLASGTQKVVKLLQEMAAAGKNIRISISDPDIERFIARMKHAEDSMGKMRERAWDASRRGLEKQKNDEGLKEQRNLDQLKKLSDRGWNKQMMSAYSGSYADFMERQTARGEKLMSGDTTMTDAERHTKAAANATALWTEHIRKYNVQVEKAKSGGAAAGATPWELMMHGFRQGGIRRGVAMGVTGGLENLGVGASAASLIGGFTGALASSLVLPIAWALGNAIMNIPKTISEEVDWRRYTQTLGARAASPAGGKAWNEQAALARQWAERFNVGPKNEPGDELIVDLMQKYQSTGRAIAPGDTAAEAERAKRARLVASQMVGLGLGSNATVEEAGNVARALGDLDNGDVDTARKQLLSLPWLREKWMERHKNLGRRFLREKTLDNLLGLPNDALRPGSATTPEEIHNLIQDVVATDPRVQGEITHQNQQTRILNSHWAPPGGWMKQFGVPDETQLPWDAQRYLANAQMYFQSMRERNQTPTDADVSTARAGWGRAPARGISGLWSDRELEVTDTQKKMLEDYARGVAGGKVPLPGFDKPDQTPAPANMPSQYSWTSFSGLAEQMQMMWSGAPVDAMQQSAVSLNNIDKNIESLLNVLNITRGIPGTADAILGP
jgi:hypothetical protein